MTSLQTKTTYLQSHVTSLESTSGSLQSQSSQLLSEIKLMESLYMNLQYIVFKGFENGHLTSALVYQGKLHADK